MSLTKEPLAWCPDAGSGEPGGTLGTDPLSMSAATLSLFPIYGCCPGILCRRHSLSVSCVLTVHVLTCVPDL